MQEIINFFLKNPQSLIGLGVWIMYGYQLYHCSKFYKLGYNFPITKISESSAGFGRFILHLQSKSPILHPVTNHALAGFQIEFWIKDTRYRRMVGRKTILTDDLNDGEILIDLNGKTLINTQNQEFVIDAQNVQENLSLYKLAKQILGSKKDIWQNKITDLSLPIVIYIKTIGLQNCTVLAYLDKEKQLIRSFRPEEKFATMIFDENYNTKLRQFFQKYRIFSLVVFVFGSPITPFVFTYNPALAIWIFGFGFVSILGVYVLAGVLDTGTFDEI